MRKSEHNQYVVAGPEVRNLDKRQYGQLEQRQDIQTAWYLIAQLPPSDDYSLLGQYLWQHGVTHKLVKQARQTLLLVTKQCNPEQVATLTRQVVSQGVLKQCSIWANPSIYSDDSIVMNLPSVDKSEPRLAVAVNSYRLCLLMILLGCLIFSLIVF